AACSAVEGSLGAGLTTVGMRVQFDHLAPTAVGGVVTAEATLEKTEGRRLTFTVSASDRGGLVGAGRMTRVVVEETRFLNKCR
ncbi:MAG TPA: hotdog domain-containing protein, partial [Acidimicrobiales bacterium]|nr:hotdog domain-containing protein [Acidimicrobiales bacterium]